MNSEFSGVHLVRDLCDMPQTYAAQLIHQDPFSDHFSHLLQFWDGKLFIEALQFFLQDFE